MTHICFIEDTHLHGGTQIWVTEAVREFLAKGHDVTVLTPSEGFVARDAVTTDARVVTYGFDEVVAEDEAHRNLWIDALASSDVAVCTVHPPRGSFHCSRFAAQCIEQAGLSTVLQPKTGTIVPEYLREFYAPPEDINYQVISITDFTRRYLIEHYGIPAERHPRLGHPMAQTRRGDVHPGRRSGGAGARGVRGARRCLPRVGQPGVVRTPQGSTGVA